MSALTVVLFSSEPNFLPTGEPYDTVSAELVPLIGRLPRDELEAVVFEEEDVDIEVFEEENVDIMVFEEEDAMTVGKWCFFLGGVRYRLGVVVEIMVLEEEDAADEFERCVFLGGVRYGSGDEDMVAKRLPGFVEV